MATTWADILDEILGFLDANEFNAGGRMATFPLKWANRVITEICQEIDIRHHLSIDSTNLDFVNTVYSLAIPSISNYLKMSRRFTRIRQEGTSDDEYIPIIGLDELYEYDPDHSETTTDIITVCSIENRTIYVYPMFTGTLILENYYRKPVAMTGNSSSPDLPDDLGNILIDLISAGVLKKCFLWLQDFDMTKYYVAEFTRLLDLYRVYVDASISQITEKSRYY